EKHVPLIIVSASGGARMQQGVLSLMQMAKTSVEIARLRSARIPFVSILTNPTTGAVSASYAMQGDVILAERGAVLACAGVRERVLVNGVPITEEAFADWAGTLQPHIERLDASFFEATTAIAFAELAAQGVDIGVIEVGLGGRLDSTNVITPFVSVVTKIAR